MINVTKTFLPDFDKYVNRLKPLWENRWITNRGKYVLELEENLKNILKVNHLLCVNNGMSALMLAIKALDIKGEVITTPFSYVATTGALLWENCTPIFVDIRKDTFCIDADKIEQAITNRTTAIVATHVFGMTCDIEKIEKIAAKHQLKVIYDAAHAFGVTYKGQSVFNYGDISISSFHATKLFHTVEGGAVICNQPSLEHKILLLHQFGHLNDSYEEMGINAKMSEFHAAMGLEMIPYLSYIIQTRKKLYIQYKEKLRNLPILYPEISNEEQYNYAYFPIVLKNEIQLKKAFELLLQKGIQCRRYFYPSLNTLPYLNYQSCPISEDIASRIMCLPFYPELEETIQDEIALTIKEAVYA